MFVTISREYGAGGSTVARLVADRLKWRLVDNQLIEEVARRAGVTPEEIAEKEERGPTFVERLARALAASTPELLGPDVIAIPEAEEARLVKITEQVVAEACGEGHAVLVGRAAVAVLAQRTDALHVRLVAPLPHRVEVISRRLGVDAEEAARRIKDVDTHRARYHKQYYDREWADARNYHLTVNTGMLGMTRSAEVIASTVESS